MLLIVLHFVVKIVVNLQQQQHMCPNPVTTNTIEKVIYGNVCASRGIDPVHVFVELWAVAIMILEISKFECISVTIIYSNIHSPYLLDCFE